MRKQTKIRPLLRVEKYQKAQGKRQIPHSKLSVHGDGTKEYAESKNKKKKQKTKKKRERNTTSRGASTLPLFSRVQGDFARPHQLIAWNRLVILRMAKMAYNRVLLERFNEPNLCCCMLNDCAVLIPK